MLIAFTVKYAENVFVIFNHMLLGCYIVLIASNSNVLYIIWKFFPNDGNRS